MFRLIKLFIAINNSNSIYNSGLPGFWSSYK